MAFVDWAWMCYLATPTHTGGSWVCGNVRHMIEEMERRGVEICEVYIYISTFPM